MNIALERLAKAKDRPDRSLWIELVSGTPRTIWREFWRDWRRGARTACYWNDELVQFRGFGIMVRVWHKDTCVGRSRANDLRTFEFQTDKFTDYNPGRIIALDRVNK